ncbi:MAG: hypothetical protein WCI02_18685 [Planctomycetota bacterium]
MIEHNKVPVPNWFWVIAVVSLLWNLIGCIIFSSEVFAQEAIIESMTDVQKEWVRSTPNWIYFVFAISVGTGLAGSILLLLRKRLSVTLFAISLAAVLLQMVYTMLIAGGLQVMGPSGAVMPTVVILLAIAWLLFSLFCKGRGWLLASTATSA